jgi:hypothetical protein
MAMEQLHKRFTNEQVKDLIQRYIKKELKREHIQQMLNIKRRQFFKLLKEYRDNPKDFSIQYERQTKTRSIDPAIEKNILKELKKVKSFIDDKSMPVWSYNYNFIKKDLEANKDQKVSLQTIINKAKLHGFYIERSKQHKAHDREVITNNVGELTQHDASLHRFSPWVNEKWSLITSLDDHSRFMFYAKLVERESTWAHIEDLQTVFLKHGLPLNMYVDSHSIFRFVQGRDSIWRDHRKVTDEVDTQWLQVIKDCNVNVIYALSAQAKGKIERPYRWIQDHLVRICARDNIKTIAGANQVLAREVYLYNHQWVHSTTKEIPYIRYQRALKENSVLRPFKIPPPYQSIKDIFCYRMDKTVDPYRQVSINNLKLKFNNAPIGRSVNLRIYPHAKSDLAEVRIWYKNELLDKQQVKTNLILPVHF